MDGWVDEWVGRGGFTHSLGCEGLVTLDAGAELAGLVADGVGIAGGGHDLCVDLVVVVLGLVWWLWLILYGV